MIVLVSLWSLQHKERTSLGDIRIYKYVYIQYRNNGKVITKYVGKLEEIMKFYLKID